MKHQHTTGLRIRGRAPRYPWLLAVALTGLCATGLTPAIAQADEVDALGPAERAEFDRVMGRTKEISTLIEAGKLAEALQILDGEILPMLAKVYGTDHLVYTKFSGVAEGIRKRLAAPPSPSPGASEDGARLMALLQQALPAMQIGDFDKALPLVEEALPLAEKVLGPDRDETLLLVQGLGMMYLATGNFEKSEAAYKKGLAAAEQRYGKDSLEVIPWLRALASYHGTRGEQALELPLLETATRIARDKSPGSAEHARCLLEEGEMRFYEDQRAGEAQVTEALTLAEALYPRDLALEVAAVNALASMRETLGQPSGDLRQRALDLAEQSGDRQAQRAARDGYAEWLWSEGRWREAEALLRERHAEVVSSYGLESMFAVFVEQNLATIEWATGRTDSALTSWERVGDTYEKTLRRGLAAGTEAQKRAFADRVSQVLNDLISLAVDAQGDTKPRATRLALLGLLRWKGRTLDTITESMRQGRLANTPELQATFAELQAVRSELASATLQGQGQSSLAEYQSRLASLNERAETLERKLVEANPAFREVTDPVTIEAVQAQIPDGGVVVDYAIYVHRTVDRTKARMDPTGMRAVAFVLHRTGEPVLVDLGDPGAFLQGVESLRQDLANPQSTESKNIARVLDRLVMQPLRPHLGDAKHILVSPDYALNLIPFAALVDEEGRYLLERYTFTYLSSGRDLVRLAGTSSPRSPALLMGNPTFDAEPTAPAAAGGDRSGELARARFSPLAGTAQEVEAIAKLLPQAESATGAAADETALGKVAGPVILHIATHGFFLKPEPDTAGESSRALELEAGADHLTVRAPMTENPLLRSGIALAGANAKGATGHDGIVTALEMAALDLEGTELVVLSACETGVGDVEFGEGVYGLRRALVIAGSRSQIMSLWKVDDAATRDLMVKLYESLKAGKGRAEAMRDAQLALLADPKTAHPYYWASFIPSGDWRPMPIAVEEAGSSTATEESGRTRSPRAGSLSLAFGVNLFNTEASGALAARNGVHGHFSLETPLLGLVGGSGVLIFRDVGSIDLSLGKLTSEPLQYPGATEAEDAVAYGYDVAYWPAVGLAVKRVSLLGGPVFRYTRRELGALELSGSLVPVAGQLSTPWLSLRGWGSALAGSGETYGGRAEVPLSFIAQSLFLAGSYEQVRLRVRDPEAARLDPGDAEATSLTITLGASTR